MSLTAIILAAGQSTRMKSAKPKPLHEVAGRPMLDYILRACWGAGCARAIVVVGFGKEEVMAHFANDDRIIWVEQKERKGTGHAVQVCIAELSSLHGDVLILAGDVPLIRHEVLSRLVKEHREQKVSASMATAVIADPAGYGRIIRDENNEFLEIREHLDCTDEQRKINEVFPSLYCLRHEDLLWSLGQLKNDNRKGEYYLTDVFKHLRDAGKRVLAIKALNEQDVLAPNSRQELALAEDLMQQRIQKKLREQGVTIVSSANTYIEDGAMIGADAVVHPFSFIGRGASIGANSVIGPFAAVSRGAIVPEGSVVTGSAALGFTGGLKG